MNAALYTKMLGATNFIVINDWNHFVYVRNICAADFFYLREIWWITFCVKYNGSRNVEL